MTVNGFFLKGSFSSERGGTNWQNNGRFPLEYWICQHLQIALFNRVFSANCNFWLRKFFHFGEIKKPPLHWIKIKNTEGICFLQWQMIIATLDHFSYLRLSLPKLITWYKPQNNDKLFLKTVVIKKYKNKSKNESKKINWKCYKNWIMIHWENRTENRKAKNNGV